MRRLLQRGFGLLEMTLAIALFTLLVLFSVRDQQRLARAQVDRASGEHLKLIQLGLQRYLDQNRAALLNGTAVAGVANPIGPTLNELRTTQALGASVGSTGPNGLTYALRVDRLPAACIAGTNCTDLRGVLWSTTALAEDGVPQLARLTIMQAAAGIDAAVAWLNNPLQLSGLDGLWNFDNPLGGVAGVIAARAGWGASTDLGAFLRRDGSDAGMVAPLQMNNNPITAPAGGSIPFTVGGTEVARAQAGGLAVSASLHLQNAVAAGAACTQAGALGRVATGDGAGMALCQGGFWRTVALQSEIGAGCATQGAAALASNGRQIVCIGGAYVAASDRLPRVVDVTQQLVLHNDVVAKPQCGAGGTANLLLTPQDPGMDPSWAGTVTPSGIAGEANRLRISATDTGAAWTIALQLVDEGNRPFSARASGVAYGLQAIARTQCIY